MATRKRNTPVFTVKQFVRWPIDKKNLGITFLLLFAAIATAILIKVGAQSVVVSVEPETATLANGATVLNDATASKGSAITFGSGTKWQTFDQMNLSDFVLNSPILDTGQPGSFRTVCLTSHYNYDDPIVYPGTKGAAHLHMFWGNTLANYTSTNQSLRDTGHGTCQGADVNRTAYWMPALIDKNGNVRVSQYNEIYYKAELLAGQTIRPFPVGLRMIAGNSMANSTADNHAQYYWRCGIPPTYPNYSNQGPLIPICQPGNGISMVLTFPQCWDGVHLDSADHISHMAYAEYQNSSNSFACPADHPVALPEVTFNIYWNNSDQTTDGWYLSSDRFNGKNVPGGTTSHGDWFGAWHPTILDTFVNECNNATAYDCKGATISQTQRLIDPIYNGLSPGDIYNANRPPDIIPLASIPK